MNTYRGTNNRPPFIINGTNAQLNRFLHECTKRGFAVSEANSFFRYDYEHCIMPAYAYDDAQPGNIKLQTLSSDSYMEGITFDLLTDWDSAISFVTKINQHETEWQ